MNMSSSQSSRPRVLVVTASVGAGHNQAGRAIVEALRSMHPDVDVVTADALSFAPKWFRSCYAGGFALMMTRTPRMYGLGFRLENRYQRPEYSLLENLRHRHERHVLRRFAPFLLAERPDLIVHTHFLLPPLVAWLRRRRLTAARQFVVVTDHKAHRRWHCPDVDHWFLPSQASLPLLEAWAIPRERITVSGMPVRQRWTAPTDREKILADWRLPADRPIVLLSGGTEFTCGPVAKVAGGIMAACPDVCLVVLAGRNKKLLGRLSATARPGRLAPVAFTDKLNELVSVCSLMVTKAGGVTTAECAARGAPMVLFKPVPGQEADNAEYFASSGAAVIARRYRDVPRIIAGILSDGRQLARMSQCAQRLHLPGTRTIVDAIRRAVSVRTTANQPAPKRPSDR